MNKEEVLEQLNDIISFIERLGEDDCYRISEIDFDYIRKEIKDIIEAQ